MSPTTRRFSSLYSTSVPRYWRDATITFVILHTLYGLPITGHVWSCNTEIDASHEVLILLPAPADDLEQDKTLQFVDELSRDFSDKPPFRAGMESYGNYGKAGCSVTDSAMFLTAENLKKIAAARRVHATSSPRISNYDILAHAAKGEFGWSTRSWSIVKFAIVYARDELEPKPPSHTGDVFHSSCNGKPLPTSHQINDVLDTVGSPNILVVTSPESLSSWLDLEHLFPKIRVIPDTESIQHIIEEIACMQLEAPQRSPAVAIIGVISAIGVLVVLLAAGMHMWQDRVASSSTLHGVEPYDERNARRYPSDEGWALTEDLRTDTIGLPDWR